MGKIVPFGELRNLRLERLYRALLDVARRTRRNPIVGSKPNPGYLELGRLLYESSMRDFKPCEIPKPLRACPWLFVLAELDRVHPEVQWAEQSMAEHVQRYLATLAEPTVPTGPEAQPLNFDAAQRVEGA